MTALATAPTQAPNTKQQPFHMPSLDGLRAVSFMIVFLAHAGVKGVPGGFGVTVFFFLSGFLITTLMRKEVKKTGRVAFKQFYIRRALRILPPFYLVLFAATLLTYFGPYPEQLRVMPVLAQALHYTNYWIVWRGWEGVADGTSVYWSLAVEEHFYFFFPALFVAFHALKLDGKRQAYALWAICAAILVWRVALVVGMHAHLSRTYVATDTRADSMLFGCALAVWNNPALDAPPEPPGNLWRYVAFPLGLAALAFSFVYRSETFRETWRYTLQGIALYPIFIVAIRCPTWWPIRFLNHRAVTYIGTLSYSLYLVHHAVLHHVSHYVHAGAFLCGCLSLAIAIGLAVLIYRFVEKPCAKLRRRFSNAE